MEKKALKIFLSCSVGAGIGTLLALNFNHHIWFLGPIIGGFFGYLSYEFKKVIAAVKAAWFGLVDYDWLKGAKTLAMKTMVFSLIISASAFSILIPCLAYRLGLLVAPDKAWSGVNPFFGLMYLFLFGFLFPFWLFAIG